MFGYMKDESMLRPSNVEAKKAAAPRNSCHILVPDNWSALTGARHLNASLFFIKDGGAVQEL